MFNHLKRYSNFALCALLLNMALLFPAHLIATEEVSSQDETTQSAEHENDTEHNKQSEEQQTKKPTLAESWRKVITLRWTALSKADAWNIGAPLVGVATLGCLLYRYFPKDVAVNNVNNNPGHNNPGIPLHLPVNNDNDNPKLEPDNSRINQNIQPDISLDNPEPNPDSLLSQKLNDVGLGNNTFPKEIQAEIALRRIGEFLLVPKDINPHADLKAIAINDNYLVTASLYPGLTGIVAPSDIAARIWNIDTGELLHTLAGPDGHTDAIISLAIAGHKVITGSCDNTAKIWDIDTGEYEYTLAGHTGSINSVAVGDNKIITGSADGTVKVWDITTGDFLQDLSVPDDYFHQSEPESIIGDKIYIFSDDGSYRVCDINTREILETRRGSSSVASVTTSDNKVVVGSTNGKVRAWDIITGQFLHILPRPQGSNREDRVAISGNKVITIEGKCVVIRDINTGEVLRTFVRSLPILGSEDITSIAVSGDKVVTRSAWSHKAKVWDINTGQLLYTLAHKNGWGDYDHHGVTSIAINGSNVVTGTTHRGVKIWPLCVNLQAPELKPFACMEHTLTISQADFIARAFDATEKKQNLIIALPDNFNQVNENESQEQTDGRIYFTFPAEVREYLRSRLRIRKR